MASIIEIIQTLQLTNSIYNTQINALLKSLKDEILDDNIKISQEKISQIIYNTQIELIEKISQDYNISAKELTKKYVSKLAKGKKSRDNLNQIMDGNSFDNLANLSGQSIINSLTTNMTTNTQNQQLSTPNMSTISIVELDNKPTFDNFINIDESPKSLSKTKNNYDNAILNYDNNTEDDLVNLLVQNKKNSIESSNLVNESNTISQPYVTTINDTQITSLPKKRGRKSKAELKLLEKNEINNQLDSAQSFEVIYKSLTIKGKNYLLNLSTNEIFDMENTLVGKKKGDKVLFKKNPNFVDV
jgi:hypothetical protein